ncbi:MAG: hypothetical protein IJE10_11300 [Clostridia bacterium]|nr:hypothetical protein [Clostridia bacterium]
MKKITKEIPCEVGTRVFVVGHFTGDVLESEVVTISITKDDVYLHLDNGCIVSNKQQVGKSVFFEKSEAEKRVKKNE